MGGRQEATYQGICSGNCHVYLTNVYDLRTGSLGLFNFFFRA